MNFGDTTELISPKKTYLPIVENSTLSLEATSAQRERERGREGGREGEREREKDKVRSSFLKYSHKSKIQLLKTMRLILRTLSTTCEKRRQIHKNTQRFHIIKTNKNTLYMVLKILQCK